MLTMRTYKRERVGELLHSFLAEQIRRMGDPRLGLVTVTAVRPSSDLKTATVWWTLLNVRRNGPSECDSADSRRDEKGALIDPREFPSETEIRDVGESLRRIAGLLQRRIADGLRLRYTPRLRFSYDESLRLGSRIDSILKTGESG